ncbi:MAG: hypothetical protein SGI96_06670 [Bacteroidota bacterium]|nr:hypothetical protein [Bacteroidota bacterium]
MREVVRSVQEDNAQFAAIEWDEKELFRYPVLLLQSKDNEDQKLFNEAIEALYKKWLVGEEVSFTIKTQAYQWNVKEQFVPTLLNQPEKNEYLARKAQKLIQQHHNAITAEKLDKEITALQDKLTAGVTTEQLAAINNDAKAMDEKFKNAVAATKNITMEQKWVENGIDNNTYLNLKPKLNGIFDQIKKARLDSFDTNYNTIAPKVEAAYAQSRTDENFNETRKDLIALQKEVIAIPLERWQKNELMDRLRAAFDHINTKQDAWRLQQDTRRIEQTETLQKQYDLVIPQALNSPFSEGFSLLKDLQDYTNKSSVLREKREQFYTALDEAFKTIKQKADSENDANFELATRQVELAISTSANTELFKEARQILISAQNDLKEIRLGKKQKDELFGKLRIAFDILNTEQDAYFNQRRKENRNQLEDTLQQMKRILARKKEGMETLYNAKSNIESKASIIKVDKKSDGSIASQFKEKLVEITAKVEAAEKDIAQLEKKIGKLQHEISEPEK